MFKPFVSFSVRPEPIAAISSPGLEEGALVCLEAIALIVINIALLIMILRNVVADEFPFRLR